MVGRSAFDDFRVVVHADVGCPGLSAMLRHQISRILFRPAVRTGQSGRNHQVRWAACHKAHSTWHVVLYQRSAINFGERVVGARCFIFRAVQALPVLEAGRRFAPFRVSGQAQVIRTTAGVGVVRTSRNTWKTDLQYIFRFQIEKNIYV